MRALVTGAAGFIGSHVVRALAASGADVRAFDLRAPAAAAAGWWAPDGERLPDGERPPAGIEPVDGDVLDTDAVERALDGCDAVFHLAAIYSYARRDAAAIQAVNVGGTAAVLAAVARSGARPRIVHTSSCVTCGPVPGRPATEADGPPAYELRVPYKRTKVESERLALDAAAQGANVVVVNPTVPVGPGDRRPTPTGKMIVDVASRRARGYIAGGILNLVAVEDVAAGHLLAHAHGRSGERYLLGGDNLGMRDAFATIAAAAGVPRPRIAIPWTGAYTAALIADVALRPLGREPELLVLDEVRVARLPMPFDDAKARSELGYRTRPAREALAAAARLARR